ncbi:uncharacterized protein N7459_009467 [Penicillium hispanicum]|uniref:uncharacterized protein n=1 Tax=Penicillium hispanicum TaxID=1080232 RepID=UPI002540972D|nr:uncharacterized protein N7459_009467 [Penicillium hispanicum]KAJ5570037.1 hypothetical protein N7459_009467 [Penicillium hispanicum]
MTATVRYAITAGTFGAQHDNEPTNAWCLAPGILMQSLASAFYFQPPSARPSLNGVLIRSLAVAVGIEWLELNPEIPGLRLDLSNAFVDFLQKLNESSAKSVAAQPIVCGSTEIYYTSGRYAGCVDPSSSFPIATSCSGSTLLRPSWYIVCRETSGGTLSCGSYTIFPTEDSHYTQGVTEYACLANWVANTLYRTLPARFAASTATPEITITESNSFDTFTATQSTTTGSSVTASPTATGSSSASQHASSGISGGAIAGIVVGGVAGVGLLVLLYIFRKKLVACVGRSKVPSDGGPAWSPAYMTPQTQSMAQTDSTMRTSEMCSEQNAIHEIGSLQAASPTQPQAVHELG